LLVERMIADYDPPVTIPRPRDIARLFVVHAPGNMVFAVDIGFNLTMIGLARWTALIGLATLLALPARAQTSAPGSETPDAGESVSGAARPNDQDQRGGHPQ